MQSGGILLSGAGCLSKNLQEHTVNKQKEVQQAS